MTVTQNCSVMLDPLNCEKGKFSKHFEVAGYSIDSLCSTLFTVLKNKNTKIRKRSAFEIYESKNIKDILIYAFSFSLGKIHRNKNGFHT